MRMYQNETIEWTRVWREQADSEKPRVLLIGDSIVDGCKGHLYNRLVRDGYVTTTFVTSKAVNNPFYLREIELLCEQEYNDYRAVYLQYGGHLGSQSREVCRENYSSVVKRMKTIMPGVPLILGSFTPLTEGNGHEKDHDTPVTFQVAYKETNKKILELREDVREIASNMNLEFFDAYALMEKVPEYKLPDGVHFNDYGNLFLGTAIAEKILSVIKSTI